MSFPPSSPVGAGSGVYAADAVTLDSEVSFDGLAVKNGYMKSGQGVFPTPNPSSSAGRLSSPVRARQRSFGGESDSSEDVLRPCVAVELRPGSAGKVFVGRQHGQCDVVLPRRKHISRRHAAVSYDAAAGLVNLECLGTNGLVVVLPRVLPCTLVRCEGSGKVFELRLSAHEDGVTDEKVVAKTRYVTSFVLNVGESVLMPYIVGTILDFRQAEAVLTMRDPPYHEVPGVSDTITPIASQNSSAQTELVIPSTPIKKKPAFRVSELHTTPVPKPKTVMASNNAIRRKLESASPVKKNSNHKHRTTKSANTSSSVKTSQEILEELAQSGVDCLELRHVLANHLAFANVQQTPLTQLLTVNSKVKALTKTQLRALMRTEPCVGIIHRQGKDAAGKPLDEEYYYDLENDPDQDRRALVSSLKGGRTGLRSCRRTHKQYFWKKPAK